MFFGRLKRRYRLPLPFSSLSVRKVLSDSDTNFYEFIRQTERYTRHATTTLINSMEKDDDTTVILFLKLTSEFSIIYLCRLYYDTTYRFTRVELISLASEGINV